MKRRNRKRNRKNGFDYAADGFYFITICVKDRMQCLGRIHNGRMCVNRFGTLVWWQWKWLERQYSFVRLHEFIVMPNHVHGVVEICRSSVRPTVGMIIDATSTVGRGLDLSLRLTNRRLNKNHCHCPISSAHKKPHHQN